MSGKDLDTRFAEAFEIASKMSQADIPQDTALRLYAYYKQGSGDAPAASYYTSHDLRNAFKANAWLQVNNMSSEEAKVAYIELVESIKDGKI